MGTRQNVHVDDKGVTHWKFIPPQGRRHDGLVQHRHAAAGRRERRVRKPEKIVLAMEFDGACFRRAATKSRGAGRRHALRGAWDGVTPRGWRQVAPECSASCTCSSRTSGGAPEPPAGSIVGRQAPGSASTTLETTGLRNC